MALQAVRHALARLDRGEPADVLTGAIVEACGLGGPSALIDEVYATPDRRYWAERAPVVADLAERGDAAAAGIIDAAADALARIAARVLDRLGLPGPVVLGGGFAVHRPRLQQAVRDRLPGVDVRVLTVDPVIGAARMATALAAADLSN